MIFTNWCSNYRLLRRHLRRGIVRKLLVAIVVLQFINGILLFQNGYADTLTRRMLDARAKIQITLVNSANRRGVLSDGEQEIIRNAWNPAEYHFVQPVAFEDVPHEGVKE